MRHRVRGRKFNRRINHRQALFKNLITALINQEQIRTTEFKAKAVKGLIDKLITRAKQGTVHARRVLGSFLHSKKTVNKLVDDIAPRFKDRLSGYTRIIRLGQRRGDNTMIVNLEFIDQEVSSVAPIKTLSTKKTKSSKPQTKNIQPLAPISTKSQTTTTIREPLSIRRTTHK